MMRRATSKCCPAPHSAQVQPAAAAQCVRASMATVPSAANLHQTIAICSRSLCHTALMSSGMDSRRQRS